MLRRPRFAPHCRIEVVGSTVYVLSEAGAIALNGRAYTALAPLLNGDLTLAEVVAALDGVLSPLEVHGVLMRLGGRGLLCEGDEPSAANSAAFWTAQDADPVDVRARLHQTYVTVRDVGVAFEKDLVHALERAGVRVWQEGAHPGLVIVVTDDYSRPELGEWNTSFLDTGQPWMLVKATGIDPWIGPVLVPGVTGCWRCLADRLEANRPVTTMIRRELNKPVVTPPDASLPTTSAAVLQLAATYAARRLAVGATELDGLLRTLDVKALSTAAHTVVRRPQCPACGEVGVPTPTRVHLCPRPKVTTADGGHRARSASSTLRRLEPHLSAITGVVGTLRRWEATSEFIHVYAATHPFGWAPRKDAEWGRGTVEASFGKGASDIQARISAASEAIERYSGLFTGTERRRRARYQDVAQDAVHPNAILHFSKRQLVQRDEWNARHSMYAWVPEPFQEDEPVEWTAAWSLTEEREKYLPTAYCYYGYPVVDGHDFCRADSNGCASGASLEDALLQAFLELVERDSVALWWYNRAPRPALDLGTISDSFVSGLILAYSDLGRTLWVLDVTSDLGIPSFVAVSRRTDLKNRGDEVIQGYGCHLDPQIALHRALTEMNQMLLLVERQPGADDPDNRYWFTQATIANQPYLAPGPASPLPLPRGAAPWSNDLRDDIRWCVDLLARRGMEMLVLDQTQPDIDIPVVRVVVPGLRHFWPRFAPGRLYDVPAELGWVAQPLRESELNPLPISS